MSFDFQERSSTIPFVKSIWSTHSNEVALFISKASIYTEIVITRQADKAYVTLRGAESCASSAPVPDDAEFLGITFEPGVYLPHIPARNLLNTAIDLPTTAFDGFWFGGSTWQFPTFDNTETFIHHLIRDKSLDYNPLIQAALCGKPIDLSVRSVQRHFINTTGLTEGKIIQINRAHHAYNLLTSGVSILEAVFEAGYFDQPHLTRSLKRYTGQTPAQISQAMPAE